MLSTFFYNGIKTKFCCGKYFTVRQECMLCTCIFCLSYSLYLFCRYTSLILLFIDTTISSNSGNHPFRKCICTFHTNTVQTTRNFVCSLFKFPSSMKICHNCLKSRDLCFWVHIYRNTSSIILNC